MYIHGYCWCFNDQYSDVYEIDFFPNFIDQILIIESILKKIDITNLKIIYTGQRHFPWTIKNAELRNDAAKWRKLGEHALRLKKYLDANKIDLLYPMRGDENDAIYRYGMYRVAEKFGTIPIPGALRNEESSKKTIFHAYNIRRLEKILMKKGIISEHIRQI